MQERNVTASANLLSTGLDTDVTKSATGWLTAWLQAAESLLRTWQFPVQSRNFSYFIEAKDSLPYSQKPVTSPLSQATWIQPQTCLFNTHFHIIFPPMPGLHNSGFSTTTLREFLFSPPRAPCPAHFTTHDWIVLKEVHWLNYSPGRLKCRGEFKNRANTVINIKYPLPWAGSKNRRRLACNVKQLNILIKTWARGTNNLGYAYVANLSSWERDKQHTNVNRAN